MTALQRTAIGLSLLPLMAGPVAAQSEAPSSLPVAIMDFVPVCSGDEVPDAYAGMGAAIGRAMARELRSQGDVQVVGRLRADGDAARDDPASDGRMIEDWVVVRGRKLGAQAVILGTFAPRRLRVDISARVVAVADGRTLGSEALPVSRNPAIMDECVGALAVRLLASFHGGLGYVIDVFPDPAALPLLLLDIGGNSQVREGTVVEILEEGDEITHPVSIRPLGRPILPVGYAVVVYIQGTCCYARVHDRHAMATYKPLQRVRVTEDWTPVRNNDLSIVNQTCPIAVYSDVPRGTVLIDGRTVVLKDRRGLVELRTGSHVVELVLDGASVAQRIRVAPEAPERGKPPEVAFRAKELLGRVDFALPIKVDEAYLDGERYTGEPLRSIGNVLAGTHTLVLPGLRMAGQHGSVTAVEEITVEPGRPTVVSDVSVLREPAIGETESPEPSDGLPPPSDSDGGRPPDL